MREFPSALAPLTKYPQFILWRSVVEDGKVIKKPVDHRTGLTSNAHNPEIWMGGQDALVAAADHGIGVGFTVTEADPFFFLDIDKCLLPDGSGWSPLAKSLIDSFPGAAVEVSQSGTGLHIIATGSVEAHGCRNDAIGLELYTEKRFIALTGTHATGSVETQLSPQLSTVVDQYFPPSEAQINPDAGWTDEPVAEWRGPSDDTELIRRALRSKSVASMFAGKVSFKELWTAKEKALITAYPSVTGDVYNRSQADSALAQHLSYWTGGDCERIQRLMNASGLVREKYSRPGYLRITISLVTARQENYYQERQPDPTPVAPLGSEVPTLAEGYQYLGATSQIEHFAGCVYVQDAHRAFTPRGALLKPEQFNATYGGFVFQLDETGDKTTKKAWEAFTESQVVRYPKAETTCFRPELPEGAIVTEENVTMVSTYVDVECTRQPGDAGPFLHHLAKVLPDENDRSVLLAYLAACVQYLGVKFQWCPLLQGVEGNGKTLFSRCVAYAVGNRYTHFSNAADLDNNFNYWIYRKLFIGIEDIYVPENKRGILEALKPMITNDRLAITPKGRDSFTGDNRANFLINTNHRDAIRKTLSDRRFAVFFSAQQEADHLTRDGMDGDYFPDLYAWLRGGGYAIVAELLATYAIPEHLNPATECHRAPRTTSTDAAVFESLGSVEQEILEAIAEGTKGFAGGWVSSMALDRLLINRRMERAIPRNKRRGMLQTLGYDYHPRLQNGRVNVDIPHDGGKPRLFIKDKHKAVTLTRGADIVKAYLAAQEGGDSQVVENFLHTVIT